jgi:hypothetical protein
MCKQVSVCYAEIWGLSNHISACIKTSIFKNSPLYFKMFLSICINYGETTGFVCFIFPLRKQYIYERYNS